MTNTSQSSFNIVKPSGNYDLTIIGAGSAGFSAAITAAEQGAQVALIGHGTIGGTCVNFGCVPSKTLIRAAEAVHHANTASRFHGIHAEGRVVDWKAMIAQKDELVGELRQVKYMDLLPEYNNVGYIEGLARFTAKGVTVNGEPLKTDKIIIASGSSPAVPTIPGIENVPYLTSTTAFELEELPRSIVVIGGGYIGCEIAQMLSRCGVDTTIVTRSRLLPEAEPEISDALAGILQDEGITVYDGLSYKNISQIGSGIELNVLVNGVDQSISAEKVLLTAGRVPNTGGLDLDVGNIDTTSRGGVTIDDRMRTSRAGVYAAGDVTGNDQFVYMAAYGAKIAAENALNGDSKRYDNTAMPAVVFTDPQVASVGFTEAGATASGYNVVTSVLPLEYVPRALAARDTRGLIKLVANAENKQLLGAHILAPEGADSIQTAALAIRSKMTFVELGEMIFPYLTTVEGLKLAAQTFEKDVSKLSCCAG
ncbi:mercury(II) reductase [uncultured Sneathiella sp.]|jgi:mercuric reductase|uniref:mercury(II) reductase n=1 Tax=uncultured Sneathiella sp. TaxID=879315 RepID=UPI0030D6E430|tara:strand:- start:263 stop:1702 length:1440 start_codon:yes stop_codon:yes gene_type:complete